MKKVFLFLIVLLLVNAVVFGQARRISGKVLDENNEGLPGAGINVRGTTIGTVTDVDGNFELDLPESNNMIVVQSLGYASQTVTVSGNSIVVNMSPSARELQGTVVTALALRREKRGLGYGTTTLSNSDLNNGNSFSALTAIQGKTAGVNITNTTGGPGGSTRIVMRGEKSLQNNNQALIVVDGIPILNTNRTVGRDARYQIDFGNTANDIDPDDIESVTVLKGAVAAALYGELAANGAVMITTKSGRERGQKKGVGVTYNSSFTLSSVLKYPEFQNRYGQGDLHGIADDRRENFSWGHEFNGQLRPWGQIINGESRIKPYSAQEDNVKSFFNIGRTWENNVQLGGSNDKSSYFVSLNTLNNKGVVPNTFYDKYGIRFNGSMDLPNNMYSSINLNYINTYSRVESNGQGEDGIYNQLIQTPRDVPVWELKDLNNPFNAMGIPDSNGVLRYGYYGAYTANPYWIVDKVDNRLRSDHLIGNMVLGYRPTENWNIFNRIGVDFVSDRATLKTPKYNYLPFEEDYYESSGEPQRQIGNGGYTEDNLTTFWLNDDLIANFNKKLNEDFNLNAMGGANIQVRRVSGLRSSIDDQTNGLVIPDYYNLNNNQGPIDVTPTNTELRKGSLYGQASLGYKTYLFLELTGRNDWTSSLSVDNNSFFYPSASLSWVFSENIKSSVSDDLLNYGKLRASFAAVGIGTEPYRNNPPAYVRSEAETGFGTVKSPYQNGDQTVYGYTLTNIIGDPDLKSEQTKTWEIGAELSFLRSRVNVDFTYYSSRTTDAIVTVPLPPSSGFTGRVVNIGEISNRGVELQVRVTPVNTSTGFRWELFGTYTKNINNVEDLGPGVDRLSLGGISGAAAFAQVGKPFGAFYATDLATDSLGRVIIDTSSGLPLIAANPVYKGTYQPRFIASWGTSLKYKNFNFNLLFDTKQGGVFYSRTKSIMDFVGTAKETENRDMQIFPNSVYLNSDGQYVTNTTFKYEPYNYYTSVIQSAHGQHIVDASYVRLREVSLTYNFSDRLLKRTFLGSAFVSVFGNNLLLWTAKENKYTDPEMNSAGASNLQGFEYSPRLSLRNYGIRLGVTF